VAFAHNGDVELFYETFGRTTDPAMLLVNGLGSQCISYRTEFCQRIASLGYLVIRYDNRDVGLSTKFDHVRPDVGGVLRALAGGLGARAPYRLADMAGDAVGVLDDLGIRRAHVVGVSMGGMIAQTMAIEYPERVASLTSIMSTTGDRDVGQPTNVALRALLAPPSTDRASYVARQLAGARAWGSPNLYDEARLSAMADEAFERSFSPAGFARQFIAIQASGSRTKALGEVQARTLVVHGDADTLIDISGGRRTAAAVPKARFVEIQGMGHDFPPEHWEQLIGLVHGHASAN
jgi:pimeloyl-ACP methyl ester carboxylesterase